MPLKSNIHHIWILCFKQPLSEDLSEDWSDEASVDDASEPIINNLDRDKTPTHSDQVKY